MTWEWLLVGILLGLCVGRWLTELRWRDNAKRVQRIESGGSLYKVLPADVFDSFERETGPALGGATQES